MSTSCTIKWVTPDGKTRFTWEHADGYPSGVVRELWTHASGVASDYLVTMADLELPIEWDEETCRELIEMAHSIAGLDATPTRRAAWTWHCSGPAADYAYIIQVTKKGKVRLFDPYTA